MIEQTAGVATRRSPSRAMTAGAVTIVLILVLLAAHAGAPYLFKRTTVENEVAVQVRAATGLSITTAHARFALLPRPHVATRGVHVTDPSGSVDLQAVGLDGDVRLLPLILGRVELANFSLTKPVLSLDLDNRSLPDRDVRWGAPRVDPQPARQHRLGTVTFVDGKITLTGRSLRHPIALTEVNVTVDWRDFDSPATLTGSLAIQHTPVDLAGWIAQPSHLLRGDRSTVAGRVHSTPLDLTATGEIGGGPTMTFKGHVMASAPSLDGLFELGTPQLPLPAPFANAATTTDASVSFDRDGLTSFDLQNFDFRADGNAYEGTLAYQGGARPQVTGTLATNHLALAPFTTHVPSVSEANHRWTDAPLPPLHVGSVDLDIRISAAHMRLAPFEIDEAALSIMTRGDRLEIGVNDGKAYGGTIKGRVSFGSDAGGLNLRAAGTIADADLATLSWDTFGWQVASGALSGSANIESSGGSAAALVAHLQGWAKGRAHDGNVFGVDLGAGLRASARTGQRDGALPSLRGGQTPFSDTVVDLHLVDGKASVDDASLQGSDAGLTVGGTADLAGRTLDLHAAVRPPKGLESGDGASPLRLGVAGGFDHVLISPERAPLPPTSSPGP